MNFKFPLMAVVLACSAVSATAGPLDKTECIAPAKPGGGFDLTCKLVQTALLDGKYIADPMRVTYMLGGIGAVAYNSVIAQRPDENNTLGSGVFTASKTALIWAGVMASSPSWA